MAAVTAWSGSPGRAPVPITRSLSFALFLSLLLAGAGCRDQPQPLGDWASSDGSLRLEVGPETLVVERLTPGNPRRRERTERPYRLEAYGRDSKRFRFRDAQLFAKDFLYFPERDAIEVFDHQNRRLMLDRQ